MVAANQVQTADPLRFQNGREFSRTAGLSERALFDLRAAGLPHMKVGGKILYNPAAALPWIERRYDATAKPGDGK